MVSFSFLTALLCTHTHTGWKKLGGPPLIFNPRAHLDMGGWAQMSLLGSQRWILNWSKDLSVYEFSYFCLLKCDSMSFAQSPFPPLLGLRRSYYPNETRQETKEVRAEVFCAPKIQMSVCFDQNRSQFFPVAMKYRQALLVSVSDFFSLIFFWYTICQSKRKHKQIVRRQCCLMKYHAAIFFSILGLFANYGRHQAKVPVASYGEAGMKSYFSSIFFTAFVFVFARHAILGHIRTLILTLIFSIQTQISLKLREIEKAWQTLDIEFHQNIEYSDIHLSLTDNLEKPPPIKVSSSYFSDQ